MAIMLSGKAVPTAASRLPTAPWRIPRRPPSISIAFVKKAAPRMIATSATTNSITVDKTHLLSDGPRDAKKRANAACLPADGLALCALALVTGREPRSVMTTGPPATAGGYSPVFMILPDEFLSLVRLFTHGTETRTDGYDAPLDDCFCWLTLGLLRPSAPFSLALYAGLGKR
jgi:hypothetical protein